MWRSPEPAIFCKASLIVFIPKMSNASEPSKVHTIAIVISVSIYDSVCKGTQKYSSLYKKSGYDLVTISFKPNVPLLYLCIEG